MKRFAAQLGLMLVLAASLAAACESDEIVTRWPAGPVTVDGKLNEWAEVPLTRLKETTVRVALSSDAAALNVLVCCSNVAIVRSIEMNGLTVWLDASGRKKKDFGIRFRGGPSVEEMVAAGLMGKDEVTQWTRAGSGAQSGGERPRMPGRVELSFVNKKTKKTTVISAEGNDGPAAKCGVARGICVYEFRIPLESRRAGDVVLGAKPGARLGVGFEWGGAPEGRRPPGVGGPGDGMGPGGEGGGFPGGGPGGMRPGGEGEGAGGEFPGGGYGGGSRGGGLFAERQEIWLKTALATVAPSTPTTAPAR